jgi:hypothetical protein
MLNSSTTNTAFQNDRGHLRWLIYNADRGLISGGSFGATDAEVR